MSGMDRQRFEKLLEMDRLLGPGAVRKIVSAFENSSRQRMGQLEDSIASHEVAEIKRICHGWRGIAASLGAIELVAALRQCELLAGNGDVHNCGRMTASIRSEYDAAHHWLQQNLPDHELEQTDQSK